MRELPLVLVVVVAAGATLSCNQFDNACNRVIREYCAHQVECGVLDDELLCQEELDAETYCRPSTTLEEFQTCEDRFDTLSCSQAGQEVCLDILCDNDLGCRSYTGGTCTTTLSGEVVECDTADTGQRR